MNLCLLPFFKFYMSILNLKTFCFCLCFCFCIVSGRLGYICWICKAQTANFTSSEQYDSVWPLLTPIFKTTSLFIQYICQVEFLVLFHTSWSAVWCFWFPVILNEAEIIAKKVDIICITDCVFKTIMCKTLLSIGTCRTCTDLFLFHMLNLCMIVFVLHFL